MPTYAELKEQIKKLEEQAEQVKQTEIETVLSDIKAKIAQYALTAEQLGFTAASKKTTEKAFANKKAAVMYRNGDLTWSGASRGRKPAWILAAQAEAKDIEQYRVK